MTFDTSDPFSAVLGDIRGRSTGNWLADERAALVWERPDVPLTLRDRLRTVTGADVDRLVLLPHGMAYTRFWFVESKAFSPQGGLIVEARDRQLWVAGDADDFDEDETVSLDEGWSPTPAHMARATRVWRHEHTPPPLDNHVYRGGDEDWVAFIPGADDSTRPDWLREGSSFGVCSVFAEAVYDGMLYVGAHS